MATVTISEEEYKELQSDAAFLAILQEGGVDNWDWYDEAVAQFQWQHPEFADD